MQRSSDRILTSHVGSLPRPAELIELHRSGASDDELEKGLRSAVADVVQRQIDAGIDIVNDGEFGKPTIDDVNFDAWGSYILGRLGGYELEEIDEMKLLLETAEGLAFPEYYKTGAGASSSDPNRPMMIGRAVGPITYARPDLVQRDVDNLNAALPAGEVEDGFITALSAGSEFALPGGFYPSADDEAVAVAEALRVEYKAIVDAGLIVQLDNPALADAFFFEFAKDSNLDNYRKWAERHVELVNHSLEGIPSDRVRCHMCWGSWFGPHVMDLPLKDSIDFLLQINADLYSVEAANVRHEHEWQVWKDVDLPDGKIVMPGVVSHKTTIVEHPELVASRIVQYAEVVGKENVIAGTDCGMGGRIHPEIAWAKLEVLSEGARLASEQLWS